VAAIAAHYHRNPVRWFILGVLLNAIVLGVLTVVEKKARRA
jgi:hypothetical protein